MRQRRTKEHEMLTSDNLGGLPVVNYYSTSCFIFYLLLKLGLSVSTLKISHN